jgi:hypothetical protein
LHAGHLQGVFITSYAILFFTHITYPLFLSTSSPFRLNILGR